MDKMKMVTPPEAPAKEFLNKQAQEYVEARFPIQTNEDNMQEDLAMKFIKDPAFAGMLREQYTRSVTASAELDNYMRNLYSEQLRLGKYLDIHAGLDSYVTALLGSLSYLEFLAETVDKTVPAGAGSSGERPSHKYRQEIQQIKEELMTIKNEDVSADTVGQILEQYKTVSIKYKKLNEILKIEDPSLN